MNLDFIQANGMELPCHIGTTPEERAFPQILRVSFRIELPLQAAGSADDLKQTIDYAETVHAIRQITEKRVFNLAEAVAEAIAVEILKHPLARATEITVLKKVFAGIESVGVTIRREKTGRI